MMKSLALHCVAGTVVALVPAGALRHSVPLQEVDVVFHQPPRIEVTAPAIPLPPAQGAAAGPPRPGPIAPSPSRVAPPEPKRAAPGDPLPPGTPDIPPDPEIPPVVEAKPQEKAKPTGLLAFRDQIAGLAQEKVSPKLGVDARYSDADDVSQAPSPSMLTTNTPGSSGGINLASLSLGLGGGGGRGSGGAGGGGGGGGALGGSGGGGPGGGGGGGGRIQRVEVGRATSPIAPGGDRPLSHGGPGPSRTDEEIQIVFDRHKAAFYRLYNLELRKNATLQGQMVLRLTIEPDGSVSMCVLQSTDMNAPDLADQVVNRVKTINFGPKDGVQALTIVYPIDFLPAT